MFEDLYIYFFKAFLNNIRFMSYIHFFPLSALLNHSVGWVGTSLNSFKLSNFCKIYFMAIHSEK